MPILFPARSQILFVLQKTERQTCEAHIVLASRCVSGTVIHHIDEAGIRALRKRNEALQRVLPTIPIEDDAGYLRVQLQRDSLPISRFPILPTMPSQVPSNRLRNFGARSGSPTKHLIVSRK